MKTYTYKGGAFETGLQVGEPVLVDGDKIVVLTILEVDFDSGTIVFMGMYVKEVSDY